MVAEISRRKYRYKKFIVADFFITNFCLWLLKFQEENIGIKNVLSLDFFITNYGC